MTRNTQGLAVRQIDSFTRELPMGNLLTLNSPSNQFDERQLTAASVCTSGAPPKPHKGSLHLNQQNLKQRNEKPHLKIDLGDEKHCNLEDDDSFEEQKGGRNTQLRKSSINITPKSRFIEPGKIFNSRQMTPSS